MPLEGDVMVGDTPSDTGRRPRMAEYRSAVAVALALLASLVAWAVSDGAVARVLLSAAVVALAGVVVLDFRRQARGAVLLAGARQRLHDTIHSMPQAVAVYDRDLRLVVSNAAYDSLSPDPERLGEPGTPFRTILEATAEAGMSDLGTRSAAEWVEWRLAAVPLP